AFLTKANARPAGPAWLKKIMGDDYFQDVVQVNLPANLLSAPEMGVGPDALEEWGKSRKEFEERFIKPLADDQLACLEPLDRLESLCFLANLPLKPEGIARLERLSRLKELNVSSCLHVDDLGRLASLTNIEILSLQVDERLETDLSFLDKMPKLRILTLGGL